MLPFEGEKEVTVFTGKKMVIPAPLMFLCLDSGEKATWNRQKQDESSPCVPEVRLRPAAVHVLAVASSTGGRHWLT